MRKFTFTLPKVTTKKGIQTVGGKYNFEDGALTVDEDVARKIKPILTKFHGCTIAEVKGSGSDGDDGDGQNGGDENDSVLSKASTKDGKASK